ncbi:MAG: hypothetical protein IJT84_05785 [Clostridia bacterium]|nr:hypothetical protein [Clostridia bacterium]
MEKAEIMLNGRISEVLIGIGGRIELAGFVFAKDAIKYVISNSKCGRIKELYAAVASRRNVTVNSVDKGLAHFFNSINEKAREDEVNRVLGLPVYKKYDSLSNSQFIALIAATL